jgi:hypothetical protein
MPPVMFFAFCTKPPCVDYIASFLPIATFFLSVAVAIVALLQWFVARNKLRLDLFDRRYKVYEATQKFVDSINNDPAHVDSYLNDFNVTVIGKAFFDIGHAPADHSNRRTDLEGYAACEIHPVMKLTVQP